MTKRKANIRPELVGELFTDGKDYFRLIDCQSEPTATFQGLASPLDKVTKPISEFGNLVLMKPVRPIEKAKKPRADKGGTHKQGAARKQAQKGTITPKEAATNSPDISTFSMSVGQGDEPNQMSMSGEVVRGFTLRKGAEELLTTWGIDQKYIEDAPDSEGKHLLMNILDGMKK